MDNAQEKIDRRAPIEAEFSGLRDEIERTYTQDRVNLENQYHEDLAANRRDREAALRAAGLNPDGSDPQERPVG